MVAITFIAVDGLTQKIDAAEGLSLMENAIGNGVAAMEAVCGGNAYCGTCRVHVDPRWLSVTGEATNEEQPIIDVSGDMTPGVRLSCQLIVTPRFEGLIVRTPASQS